MANLNLPCPDCGRIGVCVCDARVTEQRELAALRATIAEQAATIARLEGELAMYRPCPGELLFAREMWDRAEAERDALMARVVELEAPGMAYERYRLSLPICGGCGERHHADVMCPPHEVRSSRKEQP